MKSWIQMSTLACGFCALVATSNVSFATKIMDRESFELSPATSYYRSTLNSRFSISDAMVLSNESVSQVPVNPVQVVNDSLDSLLGEYPLTGTSPVVGDTNPDGAENRGIPEPGTLALLMIGLASLGVAGWSDRKAAQRKGKV